MKLVACPKCRTQYDVEGVSGDSIACRCGAGIALTTGPTANVPTVVARCAACGALVGGTDRTCAYCHATIARRLSPTGPVCPQCYARNPEDAKHCVACGVEFAPQEVRPAGSTRCPVCEDVTLRPRSLGGLWVDECPSCLGLWAPGDVLDRLVDRVRERYQHEGATPAAVAAKRRAAWQERVAYRKCPVCAGRMQRKNFAGHSGVVVDWCGDHGVWLDAGETEDIASFVLGGGLRDHAAESAAAIGGDPKRVQAALAAERILAEERARSAASRRPRTVEWDDTLRSVGDLFAKLLK